MSRVPPCALSIVLVAGLGACTSNGPDDVSPSGPATASPTCVPGEDGCTVKVTLRDVTYELRCEPVAEALVDIDLPRRPGQPKVKAITAVSWTQAVAVLWNDAPRCGLWALALADGLSEPTADLIRAEIARGVQAFGVTASPMPDEQPREG